jgi:hypothetical protein
MISGFLAGWQRYDLILLFAIYCATNRQVLRKHIGKQKLTAVSGETTGECHMVKRFISFVLLVSVALSLSACGMHFSFGGSGNMIVGSGKMVSDTREVSGFSSVSVNGSGDATITIGDSESLVIEADDNIAPLIESNVVNGKLVIGLKPGASYSTNRPIRFTISAKSLNGLETSGSGNVNVTNRAAADSFSARTSGSGNIKLAELQVKTLDVHTSGSGNVDVAGGKADSLTVSTSGSGNFSGGGLQCGSATATTSGSGKVTVWVTGSLTARTSGSGDVKYYGQPSVTKNESGSGRVTSLGTK